MGFSQVTGSPTQFPGYPEKWRALQLPDSNVNSYFLDAFGRPDREITCECERASETSMVHAMHLFNGDTLNKKLQQKGNHLSELLAKKKSPEEQIEEAYLSAFSRFPTESEKESTLDAFSESKSE